MIELIGFSKNYKSFTAVSNFSIKCEFGKITGILGPNGAGKTTILKAVCARHFASSGKVLVNGYDASEEAELIRTLTGFVTEQENLPGEYFVSEYLSQIADLHALSAKEKLDAINRVRKHCDLDEILHKKIRQLSKGQKERVNFAQALIHNPPVLVLDEPASGLDPAQIVRMRKLVNSLKENHTILLSTHLMQEVDALCDSIFIINKGKLVASGTAESIKTKTGCKTLEDAFFKLTVQ